MLPRTRQMHRGIGMEGKLQQHMDQITSLFKIKPTAGNVIRMLLSALTQTRHASDNKIKGITTAQQAYAHPTIS